MQRIFSTGLLLIAGFNLFSQTNSTPAAFALGDIKISGYFQFQYQKVSKPGVSTFAGGDFPLNDDNRFLIRRGRVRLERSDKYTNLVIQLDGSQSQDFFSLRDAYLQIKDPFFKTFTLTAGQFAKPFGYIVSYSSGIRELPERPRMFQTILPSERDLGASLTIKPPKLSFLALEFGVYNGSGMNSRDYDNKKDFSSSLNFRYHQDTLHHFKAMAGASYYHGFVRQNTTTIFKNTTIAGQSGFSASTDPALIGTYAKREYEGLNLRMDYNTASLGNTAIVAEYVQGHQPGIASSTDIRGPQASRSFSAQPATNLYHRSFNGYFIWIVKQIPHTQFQVLGNVDVYDPNTHVEGNTLGISGNNTTSGDVKYTTYGAGLVYYATKQVKVTGYFDHPVNENTLLAGFEKDIKDDIFTLRVQYRF